MENEQRAAADALEDLSTSRASVLRRVRMPLWYFPAIGVSYAVLVFSVAALIGTVWFGVGVVVCVAGIGAAIGAATARNGSRARSVSIPAWGWVGVALFVVTPMVVALALHLNDAPLWASVALAAVAALLYVAYGRVLARTVERQRIRP